MSEGTPRSCDDCTVCCVVSEVRGESFLKPAHTPCQFLQVGKPEGCCSIYADRPPDCKKYQCAWLRGFGEEEDRPDKVGLMAWIGTFNGGRWIFAVETVRGSLETSGARIVQDLVEQIDLPAIISDYDSKPPHDKGDRVVVKDSLLARAHRIIGVRLGELSPRMGIYNLVF